MLIEASLSGESLIIILVLSLKFKYTGGLYRRRWTLESALRDLKSSGFHLEVTP